MRRAVLAIALAAAALGAGAAGVAAQDSSTQARAAAKASGAPASSGRSVKRKSSCAALKGTKLRRCKAVARCKKLKRGKKRKRCLAKARKIGRKAKKAPPKALQAPTNFQTQGNVQVLRTLKPPPECATYKRFRAVDFPSRPKIDNRWLPLEPGMQITLEGRANRGGGPLPHQVTFTVTDLVKEIHGVPSLVMWDVDVNQGVLSESELAFFAQDKRGNVWNTGEYPEEYQGGVFAGAPNTWLSGQADAIAGVHMRVEPGIPSPDRPWYIQGSAPDIEFLDCATIVAKNTSVCVPIKCYKDNVLVTHETSPLDPLGGFQVKYHASRVGIVQVGAVDDPEGETLVAVKRVRLTARELDHARAEALKLDKHAYEISEVYRQTKPAKRL
jgi:hypothetical protein